MAWGKFSKVGLNFIDNSNAFINIAEGSVRSSKSVCCNIRWMDFLSNETQKYDELFIVGKTERTIDRNILQEFTKILGKSRVSVNWGRGFVDMIGRRCWLIGAMDRTSESKIRGSTIKGALVDELSLIPENFWNMLISRASLEGAKIFATTNPDSPFHYLYKSYIKDQYSHRVRSFHFRLKDNLNLSQTYIDNLTALYSGLYKRRFIDGEWCQAEGVIYDMFEPEIHILKNEVVDEMCGKVYDGLISIDYGTTNPFVALFGKKIGQNVYIQHELMYDSQVSNRQKTDSQYREDLKEWIDRNKLAFRNIIIDPSASSFKAELKQKLTNKVREAKNAVLDGIRVVSSKLGKKELFVAERCLNLIKEMTAYTWDETAQLRGEDKPNKEHDHSQDALRYMMMEFERGRMKMTGGLI